MGQGLHSALLYIFSVEKCNWHFVHIGEVAPEKEFTGQGRHAALELLPLMGL
jgi:hypothetical protein